MKTTNQTFDKALEGLKAGKIVSRAGWNGKGLFVFQQVPSEVPSEIIPRMTSLPTAVKDRCSSRGLPMKYSNQFAIVHPDNSVNGWVPSSSDIMANDWEIEEHVVAGDTVGTASPLK